MCYSVWGRREGVSFILWGGGNGVWDGVLFSEVVFGLWSTASWLVGVHWGHLSVSWRVVEHEFRDKPARAHLVMIMERKLDCALIEMSTLKSDCSNHFIA